MSALLPFVERLPMQYIILALTLLIFALCCGIVFVTALIPSNVLSTPAANLALDIAVALIAADFIAALVRWFQATYLSESPRRFIKNTANHVLLISGLACLLVASAHRFLFGTTSALSLRRLLLVGAAIPTTYLVHRHATLKGIYDALGVWPIAEGMIAVLTGVKPHYAAPRIK